MTEENQAKDAVDEVRTPLERLIHAAGAGLPSGDYGIEDDYHNYLGKLHATLGDPRLKQLSDADLQTFTKAFDKEVHWVNSQAEKSPDVDRALTFEPARRRPYPACGTGVVRRPVGGRRAFQSAGPPYRFAEEAIYRRERLGLHSSPYRPAGTLKSRAW